MIFESFFKQFKLIHLVLFLAGIQWFIFLWSDADGKLYRGPRYRATLNTNSELTISDPV